MNDVLTYLVKSFVDNPDAVSIDEDEIEGVITFTIHAAKEDMGKLIGKEGKVIRAIRNVMKIPAMKQSRKVHIQLAE